MEEQNIELFPAHCEECSDLLTTQTLNNWILLHVPLLNVSLDCPKGYYGPNCTLKCNDNCDGCNNVDGVCNRGCKPGWKGDDCGEGKVSTKSILIVTLFQLFIKRIIMSLKILFKSS